MSLAQRVLAGTVATVIAIAPSLAQNAKVAPPPAKGVTKAHQDNQPDVLTLAGDYSESHPVVTIAILKGQKDPITGEEIGNTLSAILKEQFNIPSKYFVAPGGDYTAIAYYVHGHAYGPYGLKASIGGTALAADDYDSKVRHGIFPGSVAAPGPTTKSEPKQ